jgi:regulator of replication initiation timing
VKTDEEYLEEECEEMAKRIVTLCTTITRLYFQNQRLLKENESLETRLSDAMAKIQEREAKTGHDRPQVIDTVRRFVSKTGEDVDVEKTADYVEKFAEDSDFEDDDK